MRYLRNILFLSLLVIVAVFSCTNQPCYQDTFSSVKADFYLTGSGKTTTADSLTLYALGRDTNKLYSSARNAAIFSFPLDASADSCRFYIKINTIEDTITLYYTSYTHLISKECGYTFYHILTKPIRHNKSTPDYLIINENITTVNEENIRIFL